MYQANHADCRATQYERLFTKYTKYKILFDFQKFPQHDQIESKKKSLSNILHRPASFPKFGVSITLLSSYELGKKCGGEHEIPRYIKERIEEDA